MKKVLVLSIATASSFLAFNASAQNILARVVSSTPVVQQVAVPRQVCNNQQVVTEAQKSGGGALLGAVAGGAVGNAVGNGNGRALATMIGLVGGAIVGDRVEGGGGSQLQNVQQCSTQTFYENRPSHYNVVYEYQGTQYNVQMAQDPGPYVKLQVTPVGAMPSAPQAGFQQAPTAPPQVQYQQPTLQYAPQTAIQPGYVVQQPVYVAPVVVQASSAYYVQPQPYYVRPYPYFVPSVSIGFNRGYGYGHGHGHGRWR